MATTIGSLDLNAFSDLYSDSTQYFWFESNASATYGAGAHVTLVPDTTFISNPTGQNILMNTDGFSIRNGLLPMMTLDNDSLDFNFVDTTAGTYTTMATFGLSGMRIYSRDSSNNLVQLANIGYGEGQAETGTAITPYYTFGTRASGSTIGNYSIAEGYNLTASYPYAHAEGVDTTAGFTAAHAEGDGTQALRYASHSEGWDTVARGSASHAEGLESRAYGNYSHAEGYDTEAGSNASHAEGDGTTANGTNSHAEGHSTTSSGDYSHAEGWYSTASSNCSHAEGHQTTASAYYSHAEGYFTVASGTNSHAGGYYTIANGKSQYVIGECNIQDSDVTSENPRGKYAFIIGNGTGNATADRSNAFTIDWNGNAEAAGDYYSKVNQISLGTYVASGVLTSVGSDMHFSIPTGRVFPDGTTISKLTFNIVVRAGNHNASGMYIVKSTSGGTNPESYDSTASFQFYNGANQSKTLTTAMSTISLQGGTNIDVHWLGSGNYFFSGTSTYNGYVNNQPIVIMLTSITATLNIPS